MKKNRHNESGITLIALIISIILMLILTSVIIYNQIDSYNKSKIMKFITEMQAIQEKVDILASNNEYSGVGTAVGARTNATQALNGALSNEEIESNGNNDIGDYKYLTISDIASDLDIDNATSDIIVNFNTRTVISIEGITYNGQQYYTQYNLPGGQKLINNTVSNTRTIQQVSVTADITGLNAVLTIDNITITNGSLLYKLSGQASWTKISNYTIAGETYQVNISTSGEYTFRLKDNTNTETPPQDTEYNIVLTNAPKLEENMEIDNEGEYDYSQYDTDSDTWAYATLNGTQYVWIPRYAYKNGVIKFIRGNSKIATDESFLDDTWTIPNKFTVNDTGIWVEVTLENSNNLLALINTN